MEGFGLKIGRYYSQQTISFFFFIIENNSELSQMLANIRKEVKRRTNQEYKCFQSHTV